MKSNKGISREGIRSFATASAWQKWIDKNHRRSSGVWLRISKKGSKSPSVSYKEALEIALCYGWIDGQKRPESEQAWLQRFVPRSARSIWSKINREKVETLIASGRMKAAGRDAIEAAKKNGTWKAAYDSPKGAQVPADFQKALDANPQAVEFFETIDRANRYAVLFRIQMPKRPETRARKIQEFVAMLARHEKIHGPRGARTKSK